MSKKSKAEKRINGGLAIYYGMGSALTSAGAVVALIVWGVKIYLGTESFRWEVPIGLLIFAALAGFVGYLLLRVGYDEIEN